MSPRRSLDSSVNVPKGFSAQDFGSGPSFPLDKYIFENDTAE